MTRLQVGYIGWLFFDDTEFAQAAAVCEIVPEKVEQYRRKHPQVRTYTDYRAMAEDPELDVVVISTPNWLHCEMATAFLNKGKHVFCEKPMGVNRAEIDRLLLAQRRSNRQLAIDFEMRSSRGLQRIKEICDSGELGRMRGFEFIHHRGCWLAEGSMAWRVKPAVSGGLYFMEVCHEVDFLRWLLGEVTAVQSFKSPNTLPQYEDGMPDNVYSHFWLESGAMAHIATMHALSAWDAKEAEYNQRGHDMVFVITGEQGSLRYDTINNQLLVTRLHPYPAGSHGRKPLFERIETFPDAHAAHHDIQGNRLAFLRALAEGRSHVQDAYDAWRTHAVCLAAEESARTEFRRLEIDYTEPA